MLEVVTVVYEKGVLRPLTPLNLPERQTLRIQILAEPPDVEAKEVLELLVKAGLINIPDRPTPPPPDPVSEAERRQLAERLGQAPGKPLSEIVIEDRGKW